MDQSACAGETFAGFVERTGWDDLSPDLRHEAKRSILNSLGCSVGSALAPTIDTAVRVACRNAGPPVATLFGRPERADAMTAAFINAMSGNFLDYDDTHLPTVIHPSAPIVPPALAFAEELRLSGKDVILAFLLGGEVECRIGNSVTPGHYARGWHITATCGVFGAAAASAKLLGLNRYQIGHAIGIAASQSAGIVQNLPNEAKNVSVGNAARNGMQAALFAQAGYGAAPDAIEGALGWARAAGDEPDRGALFDVLGEHWEIARNTYKPYPAGIVMHAVIAACLELRDSHEPAPEAIESVVVSGNALLLARGDRGAALTGERDAKVSIHHCVAAPLIWGQAGVREFSLECVEDPAAMSLRCKTRAALDQSMPVGAARVVITMVAGQRYQCTVTEPVGCLTRPMSDRDIEDKVRSQALLNPNAGDVDQLIEAVWKLDEQHALKVLLSAGAGRAKGGGSYRVMRMKSRP